ncbi:DUF826 domain-containing protein [Escherichia coli]|uniref:DUF826 domain-containing protein n=1 Tax=Escherichia coli TaxID=562 RepID=UPI002301D89E|nr:DUF826 domain-containing protein [Escherichia coli]MDA6302212.1 DUF826 domain-containing protein [Escherichia coli]MDZ4927395.1 DUF826 domain-containing protein [Escherichia coli]MDZ4959231.1 DUF826 domain-containing protein [Escherichia coli]
MPQRRKKSAQVRQAEQSQKTRSSRNTLPGNTFQRESPMSEIKSLVTAEAVKAALRSEDVRGALKQKVRQTFEAQLDTEVDTILDELLGPQPESQPEGGTTENVNTGADPMVGENTVDQPEPGTML